LMLFGAGPVLLLDNTVGWSRPSCDPSPGVVNVRIFQSTALIGTAVSDQL